MEPVELRYWSAPWARGRRVTERAARALLAWTSDRLGLIRVDRRATVGDHASRLTGLRLRFAMIGLLPGVSGRTEEWTAALVPPDQTAPGHEVAQCVRRQAAVFGGDRRTPAAGPVTLRPPDERDIAAQVAAYRDPEVIRWYGCTPAALLGRARWGVDRLAVVRGQWRAEAGSEASRRVAEKAGFTMEGLLRWSCTEREPRRECGVGSAAADEVAA